MNRIRTDRICPTQGSFGKEPNMTTMTQLKKVLYTAKVHTTGGRDGGVPQL